MITQRNAAVAAFIVFVFVFALVVPVSAEVVDVKADSYVLMDADSSKLFLAKNENKRLAPASMTKLMTLILAVEALEEGKVELKDNVITSENAWKMGGSQIYLEPGEEMTYEEMLIAIAVGSANDACVAVAEHLEGTHQNFVDNMNKKGKAMGLKNTHFSNSHGLSEKEHYTSSYDLAVMAREALAYPRVLEYCSIKEYSLRQGEFKLFNTNKLLWWYEGTDGFKTGFTNEAKHCLVATAKRDGLRLISVVMASPESRGNFRDSMQILNYGFAKYSHRSFFNEGNVCGVVNVGKGRQDSVEVVAKEDVGLTALKGEEEKITCKNRLFSYIDAPVKEGQKLGEIMVYNDGQLEKKVDLVASFDVPPSGLLKGILKMLAETYLL